MDRVEAGEEAAVGVIIFCSSPTGVCVCEYVNRRVGTV
jgi:hypothetical protein